MMRQRLVVIGADAAGSSDASAARRGRGPDELETVAVDRGNYSAYSACGVPYFVATEVDDVKVLIARSPAQFRAIMPSRTSRRVDASQRGLDFVSRFGRHEARSGDSAA